MNRDYNIRELEKHLKQLQGNLTEGHTGGCLMIIADALTELNMIKDLANVDNTTREKCNLPVVIGSAYAEPLINDLLAKAGRLIEPLLQQENSKSLITNNQNIAEIFGAIECLKKHYL